VDAGVTISVTRSLKAECGYFVSDTPNIAPIFPYTDRQTPV